MSKRYPHHFIRVSTYSTVFTKHSPRIHNFSTAFLQPSSISRCAQRKTYGHHKSLHSALSTTSLVGGIVISLAGLFFWASITSSASPKHPIETLRSEKAVNTTHEVPWIQVYPDMSPQIPAGRPSNLTHDQEVKLKELWEALMGVCGIISAPESESASANSTRPPTPEQAGKKKHRLGGLLGRKKQNDEVESTSSSVNEDKHGLNKEFQQALISQTPEELRDTFWFFSKADDPDAMLLRFLRARKWNVHDALVMLVSTIHWRAKVIHLDDDVMKNGEAGAVAVSKSGSGDDKKLSEDFLTQMRMGKSFLHGTDREGRPLCFVRVKLHKAGEQSNASLERYTVYTIETARFMLRPPVDTAVLVFDMTDFSMANMDYTPVKFMIKVFEANYPESLGAVLVHKSPWLFQGIWSIIKGWLDPVVASKVHFTKNGTELEQYIDPTHIPKSLGGREDWEYSYVEPEPNENAAMQDASKRQSIEAERAKLVKGYEDATIEWVKSANSSASQGRRAKLAEQLRHNYWKLDPHIRARSLYDRTGVIRHGGTLNFYGEGASAGLDGADTESLDDRSVFHDAHEHH